MNSSKTLSLAVVAAALLLAGVFFTLRKAELQADLGNTPVFADLQAALGEITEIRLSKGDGSLTTLRRDAAGWTVVERQYPADPQRVRELALGLANLRAVERKTADPANYSRLGVEAPSPTASSALVEIIAKQHNWSLLVGKSAEGRAVYVRRPTEAASLLATPALTADPDPKRWLDRLIVDLPNTRIHEISAKIGTGPAYRLTRAQPGVADLTLSPVPKGRTPVSNLILSGQADALVSLNFDEIHTSDTPSAADADSVTYRTFDGQVIRFTGRREGEKAYVRVSAQRDPALAAQFAPPADAKPDAKPEVPDQTTERLAGRAAGVEFEIPLYKYGAIFKPFEELLEKKN